MCGYLFSPKQRTQSCNYLPSGLVHSNSAKVGSVRPAAPARLSSDSGHREKQEVTHSLKRWRQEVVIINAFSQAEASLEKDKDLQVH